MHELRRTRSGPFTEGDLVTMYDLSEALDLLREEGDEGPLRRLVRPVEDALALLPKLWIRDSAVDALCNGASLMMPGILRLESGIGRGEMVAVLTQRGEAVALMEAEASAEEMLELERGVAAKPVRVLMPRGTYPRMW
jgi:H/ACA ribonucleoprotein complex subunit 4